MPGAAESGQSAELKKPGAKIMKKIAAALAIILGYLIGMRAEAQVPVPHGPPTRPLIFIPGIAGSELWLNGTRAWGSVGAMRDLENLRIPDGPKDTPPAPTCDPNNRDPRYVASCGPINQLVILGKIKYDVYEPLFQYLETLGYTRFGSGTNLFIFSYDWRQSNFDTAADLNAFINATPALAGKEIDILAHSMGGLVALIYAHRYDAPSGDAACEFPRNCRLKTVVTMGTPYSGSVSAVQTPVEGWGWLSRKIAGGQDAITRTVLSWPSLYELLPTFAGCCTLSQSGTSRALDLMKPEDFADLPFGPGRAGISPARVADALGKAADLQKLADSGFPRHVHNTNACTNIPEGLYLIAGDRNGTSQNVVVKGNNMEFVERRGDGTVLLRSASLGNPAAAFLSFSTHMKIFNDENVKAKLETILFRCEMAFRDFAGEIPTVRLSRPFAAAQVVPIDFIAAEIVDPTTNDPQAFAVRGALSVAAAADAIGPTAHLRVKLNGTEFYRADLPPKSKVLDGGTYRFGYEYGPIAAMGEGRIDLEMTFGDGGPTTSDQSYVLGR
jgi:pimeloyl-ACP methyl ester carboxylesterase